MHVCAQTIGCVAYALHQLLRHPARRAKHWIAEEEKDVEAVFTRDKIRGGDILLSRGFPRNLFP